MDDLSLHILDIAENCINAGAKNIEIFIIEDTINDKLVIEINDDGKGMNEETVNKLADPFFTSRTTRKVGLGIPLLKDAAENANGSLEINSKAGIGTKIKVVFQYNNVDRQPLGEISDTILALAASEKDFNLRLSHKADGKEFEFDLGYFKELAEKLNIDSGSRLILLKKYLNNNYNNLK